MKKIFKIIAIVLAGAFTVGATGCDNNGGERSLVDEMVGEWEVSGGFIYMSGGETIDLPCTHKLTISKIDDETIRIENMLGLSTYHSYLKTNDVFMATVKDGTISIPAQPMTPTFTAGGEDAFMCRWIYSDIDPQYGGGFGANWMQGFENIPIRSDMSIDLSLGGYLYDRLQNGLEYYATFVFLSQDDNGQTFNYNWFYYNTEWKKI